MLWVMLVIKNGIKMDVYDRKDVIEKKDNGQYHHPKLMLVGKYQI